MPTYNVTWNCEEPVIDVLMTSAVFKELVEKNKDKDLVILRQGRAISSHFPCDMITDIPLEINFTSRQKEKRAVEDKESKVDSLPTGNRSAKAILFHVSTSGKKLTKFILKNQEIKSLCDELTIYTYEDETLEDALRRDGRFLADVLDTCQLTNLDDRSIFELSNFALLKVNEKSFKVSLKPGKKRKNPLKSESRSSGGAGAANKGDQNPSQLPTTTETENESPPKGKPKQNDSEVLLKSMHEIPNSQQRRQVLIQMFNSAMNINKENTFSEVQQALHVEYAKNEKRCREVRVMRKLIEIGESVCLVAIDDSPIGTGFLFFDRFVLTNYHVVQYAKEQPRKISVCFMYENFYYAHLKANVEELLAWENTGDWALLKLDKTFDASYPCLLEHFGYLPLTGGLCIIGHPDCGVKKVDPCCSIPSTDEAVDKQCAKNPQGVFVDPKDYGMEGCVQCVGSEFFQYTKESISGKKSIVAYNTCFFHGASGSPVFDNECKVVAIHTGGYIYKNENFEIRSVIEYGILLSHIIENMIIALVQKKRFDVLRKYLSVDYSQKGTIMDGVKQRKESRGFTVFDDARKSNEVTTHKDLKDFFEFICCKEISHMKVEMEG